MGGQPLAALLRHSNQLVHSERVVLYTSYSRAQPQPDNVAVPLFKGCHSRDCIFLAK